MLSIVCLAGLVPINNLAVQCYPDRPTKLTAANCQLLRTGMSRLQVAAIVGGRGTLLDCRDCPIRSFANPKLWSYLGKWKGAEVILTAWFDDKGKLTEAYYETQPDGELRVLPKFDTKP
jgi:hypothetical protein